MPRFFAYLPLLALAACAAASQPAPKGQASPVVIELFQSQGCSSCPPALAVLNQEADRADVIALNFAVTYWDYLGWKDNFAKPEFTARQWDYARGGGRGNVQTPQLIVNGAAAVLGSRKAEVDNAIRAAEPASAVGVSVANGRVSLGSVSTKGKATVWLVTYDPRAHAVPIRAGENDGRTLVHRNIVTGLQSLGTYTGTATSFAVPQGQSGLARVVLVQQDKGGPIWAARRI